MLDRPRSFGLEVRLAFIYIYTLADQESKANYVDTFCVSTDSLAPCMSNKALLIRFS